MAPLIQPRPWRVAPAIGTLCRVLDANDVVVLYGVTRDEADLIVRACNAHEDLLAALKAVGGTGRVGCWCDPSHDPADYGHQIKCERARAAIAKAEGK